METFTASRTPLSEVHRNNLRPSANSEAAIDPIIEIYTNTANATYSGVREAHGRELPLRLLELAQLPTTPSHFIAPLVDKARREHDTLAEEFIPHLSWGDATYLDIFIRDPNLPPEYRQNNRAGDLRHALQHVREEDLLSGFERGEIPKPTETITPEMPEKTSQARHSFEAAIRDNSDPEQKRALLNLALDTALSEIEKMPEDIASAEGALAYLIASRSIHDLSATIGIFEERMTESEALDFRARGLELAQDWAKKAASYFSAVYDQPIGTITEDTYPDVEQTVNEIQPYLKYINDALWFSNVYKIDYNQATETLENRTVKSIGRQAVTAALKPVRQSEPSVLPS